MLFQRTEGFAEPVVIADVLDEVVGEDGHKSAEGEAGIQQRADAADMVAVGMGVEHIFNRGKPQGLEPFVNRIELCVTAGVHQHGMIPEGEEHTVRTLQRENAQRQQLRILWERFRFIREEHPDRLLGRDDPVIGRLGGRAGGGENRQSQGGQQTEQAFHEFHDRQVSLFRYFPITLSQIAENLQDTGGRRWTRAEAQEDGKKTSAGGD